MITNKILFNKFITIEIINQVKIKKKIYNILLKKKLKIFLINLKKIIYKN